MMINYSRQIMLLFLLLGFLVTCNMSAHAQVADGQEVRGPGEGSLMAADQSAPEANPAEPSINTNGPSTPANEGDPSQRQSPAERAIADMYRRIALKNPELKLNEFASLLFTASQHSLIMEAKAGFMTRPPEGTVNTEPPPMGPREIALGGIVYVSKGDWAVWLNGQKIGPDNLPPEILDIRVSKEFIKIKWYDAFTNQVFPIKIRAHQRFNIDTRIFLPG